MSLISRTLQDITTNPFMEGGTSWANSALPDQVFSSQGLDAPLDRGQLNVQVGIPGVCFVVFAFPRSAEGEGALPRRAFTLPQFRRPTFPGGSG